ncbi:hypothetical protein [Dolichospermum circinale]|nr:hypothetical protein [Dolichospermum circinale]MDB9470173.1 hypothetical protein [Dolichospermum circinale CS-539]
MTQRSLPPIIPLIEVRNVVYSINYRQMQEALKDLLCLDIQPD